ncbi:N(5)-(carboxyethyl)ornithine synthase [Riemerella anatipestifer]|uniref:N(5)-(carboxyethyl)ornithine synthase n=1 Tax=Riemerella anatipestifer TaxID=34085 RepID=UPI00069B4B57|nr:N(5)-(carboxyethyl)ornithine synthase [Riemerella anatipestifer]MCW0478035.1 hypothetical protein [Riemerella anatipestifer]MDY3351693.1 hypothetical protein [Riemerella anatipestifer]MSN86233.1 N(5)-(carboxyethyl)ornithine synthase [Riemerella anatipestifer]WFS33542.1 hypothetical protein D1Y77_003870 [Riemerella anatipestifer]
MKIGVIKPDYPFEKRVAVLPQHILNSRNTIIIEESFGENLKISDEEYQNSGAIITSREEIFKSCDVIFSLKLLQPSDYKFLREGQTIVGWTHPNGSGKKFMTEQAIPKKLKIIDLDNIFPKIFYLNKSVLIDFIKPNFIYKNSFNAGLSAVMHAIVSFGLLPNSNTKVAILSMGNVSQGALSVINKFNTETRVFYRKTMNDFYKNISYFDIIINGIEVDNPKNHIITKKQLLKTKKGCFLIDAAADAGNAIEGTRYTSIKEPIYEENDRFFYVVNNAPSIFYRTSSEDVSKAFSEVFFNEDFSKFQKLIDSI